MRLERSTYLMAFLFLVVGVLVLYPLFMIFYGSFRSDAPGVPGFFTLKGYAEAYSDPGIYKALGTTFWLATLRTLIASALAVFFAWILVRTDLPYKRSIEVMLWLPFFLPMLPMAMAWVLLLSPHYGLLNQALMKLPFINSAPFNIFSLGGIIWAHTFFGTAIRLIMIAPAFKRMDASLEESARMCGAGGLSSVLRITVPVLL